MAHQKQEMFGQHLEYVYIGVWSNSEILKMDTVSRDSQNSLCFFPQIQFREKVLWTAITLFIFLVCCQVSKMILSKKINSFNIFFY